MALDLATYQTNLNSCFQVPLGKLWSTCVDALTNFTKGYIESGTLTTAVAGTVTPPFLVPYPASGIGIGSLTTDPASVATMTSVLKISALDQNTSWETFGEDIATQIKNVMEMCTAQTTVTGGLTGVGIGNAGCVITLAAFTSFKNLVKIIFKTSTDWTILSNSLGVAIDTFIKACTVTTTDSGTIPPVSWGGAGTGTIS